MGGGAAIRVERFRPTEHAEALEQCHAIRHAVFVVGQGVPESLEWDGLDDEAEHFLALDTRGSSDAAVGTARLRIVDAKAKAERVAVLDHARERGVGEALMRALESRAHALGLTQVHLNAQTRVLGFYERLGYRAHGDVFLSAGIDHRAMTLDLDRD